MPVAFELAAGRGRAAPAGAGVGWGPTRARAPLGLDGRPDAGRGPPSGVRFVAGRVARRGGRGGRRRTVRGRREPAETTAERELRSRFEFWRPRRPQCTELTERRYTFNVTDSSARRATAPRLRRGPRPPPAPPIPPPPSRACPPPFTCAGGGASTGGMCSVCSSRLPDAKGVALLLQPRARTRSASRGLCRRTCWVTTWVGCSGGVLGCSRLPGSLLFDREWVKPGWRLGRLRAQRPPHRHPPHPDRTRMPASLPRSR